MYRVCLVFGIVLCALIGCAKKSSTPVVDHVDYTVADTEEEPQLTYTLETGDVIDVKFFYNPELNETVTIRPDGVISLQLLDEVEAAGLTPSALDSVVTQKYSSVLLNPEITIIVREFAGQKVFVGGEVRSPGLIDLSGRQTVLQAIFQAGGFKNTAEMGSIVVLRNQGSKDPSFVTVNLKDNLNAEGGSGNILLKPYDVVYVPPSTIARLDQFVDQYINKLIPIHFMMGFNWIYDLNPEVRVIPE